VLSHPSHQSLEGQLPLLPEVAFFFVDSLLAYDLWRPWRDYMQSGSCPLSAQVAARC